MKGDKKWGWYGSWVGTFQGFRLFWRIAVPSSAKAVGHQAFRDFRNLTKAKAELRKGVKEIKKDSFWNCVLLRKARIASSTASVGERAFLGCM